MAFSFRAALRAIKQQDNSVAPGCQCRTLFDEVDWQAGHHMTPLLRKEQRPDPASCPLPTGAVPHRAAAFLRSVIAAARSV